MIDAVRSAADPATPAPPRRRRVLLLGAAVAVVAGAGIAALVAHELDTSRWQARRIAEHARGLRFELQPGPNATVRFPAHGPFDERLGYTRLPGWTPRLAERGYVVAAQARWSPALVEHVERHGWFPPYREKTQAGLAVLDCRDEPLYRGRYPHRQFASFDEVPPLLRETLAFVEDRRVLAADEPAVNPAVDPRRLARALFDQGLRRIDADHPAGGGSTLATQIEKFRHSPEGRTASAGEKLRQIASASVRAYADGEDTHAARRRIVLDYVNSVPLGAQRGWGEVHGLADGLEAWYGTGFGDARRAFAAADGADAQARVYRQALSLVIAQRRPAWYLGGGRDELDALVDAHLRLLAEAGVVPPAMRDAALRTRVVLRDSHPTAAAADFAPQHKAAHAARTQLAALLGAPRLYDVDRLDLVAATTIDGALQAAVGDMLHRLADPRQAAAAGLVGERLLERGDPARLHYSFTLFERGDGVNRVRVHTDNVEQPFDLATGAKLELGSTAKLRTLATWLELVAALHEQLAALPRDRLAAQAVAPADTLTRWALEHLASAPDRSLAAMLDAALQRRFSASPHETFFTGGGEHRFSNYDARDDRRLPSIAEALRDSLNLPFVRLLREIVAHHVHRGPESAGAVLGQKDHPERARLLARFADREGRQFTRGFYRRLAGKTVDQLLEALAGAAPTPQRLAVIHRTLRPDAGADAFAAFVGAWHPKMPDEARRRLHEAHAPGRFELADRGYLAGLHPLELAVAAHLAGHPAATLAEVIDATADERQQAYAWLQRSRATAAQDRRIRTLLEIDAFEHIHASWRRMGYPFDTLVPSYATALGSSGDRPAALAELMGIVLAGGVRQPTVQIEQLRFAAATPYETAFTRRPAGAEQVFAPEVAAALKAVLAQVVEQGTARRLRGAFVDAAGAALAVGGKTGTGDNRRHEHGTRGERIGSRVLNRTATFVFFVGERHFGTLTALVQGPEAEHYRFTSALPAQILKAMAPTVAAAIGSPAACERRPARSEVALR